MLLFATMLDDVADVLVAKVVGALGAVGTLGEVFVAVVVLLDMSLELVLSKLILVPIHVFRSVLLNLESYVSIHCFSVINS